MPQIDPKKQMAEIKEMKAKAQARLAKFNNEQKKTSALLAGLKVLRKEASALPE